LFPRAFPVLLIFTFGLACGHDKQSRGIVLPLPDHIQEMETVFLSAGGDDGADGFRNSPMRTWAEALKKPTTKQVVLLAGVYPDSEIEAKRPLRITGDVEGKSAQVQINLSVRGGIIEFHDLNIKGRVRLRHIQTAHLRNLHIECESGDCLHVDHSLVRAQRLSVVGHEKTQRNILVESSTLSAQDLQLQGGGQYAQLLARDQSVVQVQNARLSKSQGIGIATAGKSRISLGQAHIDQAKKFSVVSNRSQVDVRTSTLGTTQNMTVGNQGGQMNLVNCTIYSSPQGTINTLNHRHVLSTLHLENSQIYHQDSHGLSVSGGHAKISDTVFRGDLGPHRGQGGDAIIVTGPNSSVEILESQILNASGFGVSFLDGGFGSLSANIRNAQLGAIFVQSQTTELIRIHQSSITDTKRGNGITVLGGNSTTIENVDIQNSAASGIMVGQDAEVIVKDSRLHDNAVFQMAAFGEGQIQASNLHLLDVYQNAFASCGQSAQIEFLESPGDSSAHETLLLFCP
jgi:hypothetical protein